MRHDARMLTYRSHARRGLHRTCLMDVSAVTLLYGVLAIVGMVTLVWLVIMAIAAALSRGAAYGFEGLRQRFTPYALSCAWVVGHAGHRRQPLLLGDRPLPALHAVLVPAHRHVPAGGHPGHRRPAAGPGRASTCSPWRHRCRHLRLPLPPGVVPRDRHGRLHHRHPLHQVWFRQFGFVSLPLLALIAFLLVIAFLLLALRPDPAEDEGPA